MIGCKKEKDSDEDKMKIPEFEMVFVEGGTFMMGSEYYNIEEPIHEVTLSSFKIAKYQVTQKEWKSLMGDNPSSYKGDNLPVHKVNWYDIDEFISRLNQATGKNYRLPTEAEWEYAAGGGNKSQGFLYSGSNNIDKVAWYIRNTDYGQEPVGTKAANELGIYDMSGNVWEWCSDWYGNYPSTPQIDPKGPISGEQLVIRGGCIYSIEAWCRVTMRMAKYPISSEANVGFRLVLP
jgi:formylglycine-generating enzyme required for sulfatase activity